MLAKTGSMSSLELLDSNYIAEPKLDGIRCIAVLQDGELRLYNRQLIDITARFPEVTPHIAARNGIFDGELVCIDISVSATPDFQAIQTRANREVDINAAAVEHPARFMPFDILHLNGVNLCNLPLYHRRNFLLDCQMPYTIQRLTAPEITPGYGEGVMLKEVGSPYYPGLRSKNWIKVKFLKEEWFTVGGVTHGKGKRAPTFGALLVGSFDDNNSLKLRGEVGTGFTDEQLESIYSLCLERKINVNPFENVGDTQHARFFIRPTIQIKVRFQDYTDDGRLRFPRYVGAGNTRIHDNNNLQR
jgi:bifunctional non-homologous end joining protein LigD